MSEGLLLMSERERDRAHVVRQAMECGLSQQEAAERLGIGVRQFKRLVRAWKQNGASGLISRQRGKPSHNRLDAEQRTLPGDNYLERSASIIQSRLFNRSICFTCGFDWPGVLR